MMGVTVGVNQLSVVHKDSNGISIAFPDVCMTPAAPSPVPVPYPNIAKSSDTAKGSQTIKCDGKPVCLKGSNFSTSSGDEAGVNKGVVSGKIKGKAEFINYSFDVKMEGKNVARALDLMLHNDRNTPPVPVIQKPVIAFPDDIDEVEKKCPYCNKSHSFSKKPGNHVGSGTKLSKNIFKSKKIEDHPWYTGKRSLEAHHLVNKNALSTKTDAAWADICFRFGYDINHKKNGIMLPSTKELACQLFVQRHRGKHGSVYFEKVLKLLFPIREKIESGKYCSNPDKLIKVLNKISGKLLDKIDRFKLLLYSDGMEYNENGNGCGGKNRVCSLNRNHGLKQFKTGKLIPSKKTPLKTGE